MHNLNERFHHVARKAADLLGTSYAFLIAVAFIVVWVLTGPIFHFSDTWQLVINTATTIITFLMVFLIQNTQNRDSRALHLKLDEMLRALQSARTELVDLEDMPDEKLDELQAEFHKVAQQLARHRHDHPSGETSPAKTEESTRNGAEDRSAGASQSGDTPAG